MSTASISRQSPSSSPAISTGRHAHLSTPPAGNRTPTSPNSHLQTPRPAMSRHIQEGLAGEACPNYFNLTIDSSKSCESGGGTHARANWSPPSSHVRSIAAISPRVIPLDQNPDFAEFRRQSELRSSTSGFNFSLQGQMQGDPTTPVARDNQSSNAPAAGTTFPNSKAGAGSLGSFHNLLQEKPHSPKRTLSSPYADIIDRPRRNSPAGFTEREAAAAPLPLQHLHASEDEIRFSLPHSRSAQTPPPPVSNTRAETLPANIRNDGAANTADGTSFASPSHIVTLLDASSEEVLLLDLRASAQYARSRIQGALNLCIPTTLLKRPSYNTQKLAETFQRNPDQKSKFERWRSCKYIVVYDGNAAKTKDAMACVNMLKKFGNEGWKGISYIVRGGFLEFSRQFPALIHHEAGSASSGNSPTPALGSPGHGLAPVIGGCPMPATKNAANPFFGNIRQNMDLIGGVGQIPVKLPSSMTVHQMEDVPKWLREACDEKNNGKAVANKFLAIEEAEQHRMQEALSSNMSYNQRTPRNGPEQPKIRIAGIEKGSKNRYNNIWPYEHSRVKIQQVPEGACDYINANHVKAAWSNKRYIATQGPIPATFNDFWNVVWQQDVRVIVMLTAETESGQVKAHNYWSQKNFGPVHLNFLSEHRASLEPSKIHRHRDRPAAGRRRSTNPPFGRPPPKEEEEPQSKQPYVIVRRFTMSRNDSPFERMREITQLQYSHWPDFGAPAHPAHLLGLVEQCDAVVRATGSGSTSGAAPEESRPILVHCSAGCGRTGTFCTVDSVIDMLKRQRLQRGNAHARQMTPMDVDSGLNNSRTGSTTTLESVSSGSSTASSLSGMGDRNWIVRDDIDLVQKTVEDFRDERLSMVQSLRQFVLCYESVLEWMVEQTPRSA